MALIHHLGANHAMTRETLHRIATHVLARRRATLCGKFGLRATPGGIGTPACGPDHEVVRLSGTTLIRELTGASASTTSLDLQGVTFADAARLVDVDLAAPFEAGHDTPPVGDADERIVLDADAVRAIDAWFTFGWAVLDATISALPAEAQPSVVQLWPEHFDAGCDVGTAPGRRANLGASPGDSFSAEPYLYVGPWDDDRPGDPAYWNAPFGAVLRYASIVAAPDPRQVACDFLRRGIALLGD